MKDIHALKQFLKLMVDIAVPIIVESKKDGFQWPDLFAFLSSEQFKADVGPALRDLPELGDEFSDFTLDEAFELAMFILVQSKDLMAAMKK